MKSVKALMNLKGKIALITGGAGHIGSVMAEALAEGGSHVILLDNNEKQCLKKAKNIRSQYKVKVLPLTIDLHNEGEIRSVASSIKKKFGGLDILINCAAYGGTSSLNGWAVPFQRQSAESWEKALDINVKAIFILVQSCEALLKRSKTPSIINISSIYGLVAPDMGLYRGSSLGNPAAYGVSKAGLNQLTRWLATNLSPKIRVNTITLGGIYRGHKNPFLKRYIKKVPLNRMGSEEDLKGATVYLASNLSNYVTGHNLVIDGGLTAW